MWKRETGDNLLKFPEEGEPHDRSHDTPFGPQETVNEDDESPVLPLSSSTSRNLGPPHSGWRLLGRVGEIEKLCVTMNAAASMQTIYLANKVYRVETYQSFVREISHDYWPWLRDSIQSAWGMTTQS